MIAYHGTISKGRKLNILKNGFMFCEYGNYGKAIYLTTHFELARDYTVIDGKYDDDLVIPVHICNKDIKCLQYRTIARRLGKVCPKNPSFESALALTEVESYCKKNRIKALLIQYNYYDEIVVYDKNVIKKIGA